MSKLRQILRQHAQGAGSRTIEKNSRVSRKTVRKYIATFKARGMSMKEVEALSNEQLDELFNGPSESKEIPLRLRKLEQFFADGMEKKLRKVGMTRKLLWEQYITNHPDGYRYPQFCRRFKIWARRSNPTMHIIHTAGDKLFIDYAGKKLKIVGDDKKMIDVEVFITVLGSSQLTYMEASLTQSKEDFIGSLERALHYYGGVPAALVPDNLKSAVAKANRYEPTLNQSFEDFANHYSTVAMPARALKPQDKSLVEGAVRILYTRIYTKLKNKRFASIEALNKRLWELLESEHNERKFSNKPFSRRQLFEETEREALQPLPRHRYELKKYAQVTVMKNGHVHLGVDKHYYSVPYKYIGRKVRLAYSRSTVEVYYKYGRIAAHKRIRSPYNYTTVKEHLASTHQFVSDWSAEMFLERARKIAPEVELLIKRILDKKRHPEQAYKSCMGVLSFEARAGRERLIKACSLALSWETYNYMTIEDILRKGMDRIEPEEDPGNLPPHGNIRGKGYYN